MTLKGRFGCKTDIGLVRPSNEDKAISLIDPYGNVLLCVCDGMGGYMKGDFASKIASDILSTSFINKRRWLFSFQVTSWVNKMIKTINNSVFTEASEDEHFTGMGTTLCMAVFFRKKIYLANVGDSRAYALEKDEIRQLTRDQTLVEYEVSYKKITKDEKLTSKDRHVIMNFIGKNKKINFEYKVIENEGKTILLCSDGLYNNAQDKQIFSALDSQDRLDQKIGTLIGIAKANGGTDNIAVSIWEPYKDD